MTATADFGANVVRHGAAEVANAIQWILLSELLHPVGPMVWIVAPVLEDAPVLDNRAAAFEPLEPGWPVGPIRLSDVVVRFAASGIRVMLIARDSPRFSELKNGLEARLRDLGLEHQVRVLAKAWLTASGIVTGRVALQGALSLEREGIRLREAFATITTDPPSLSAIMAMFVREYEAGA